MVIKEIASAAPRNNFGAVRLAVKSGAGVGAVGHATVHAAALAGVHAEAVAEITTASPRNDAGAGVGADVHAAAFAGGHAETVTEIASAAPRNDNDVLSLAKTCTLTRWRSQ